MGINAINSVKTFVKKNSNASNNNNIAFAKRHSPDHDEFVCRMTKRNERLEAENKLLSLMLAKVLMPGKSASNKTKAD